MEYLTGDDAPLLVWLLSDLKAKDEAVILTNRVGHPEWVAVGVGAYLGFEQVEMLHGAVELETNAGQRRSFRALRFVLPHLPRMLYGDEDGLRRGPDIQTPASAISRQDRFR